MMPEEEREEAAGMIEARNLAAEPTCSRSVTRTVNGSHKFVIQGYSLAKGMGIGKHISSDTFSVGGYEWAIYFYPDGRNIDEYSAYVSIFIALASEGTDVRALFQLTLLDQSGNGKHKVHSHFDRSLEGGPYTLKVQGSMWGFKRFYRRVALETSDYLKDDCLRINCTVGVVVSSTKCSRAHAIHVPQSDIGSHLGMLLDNQEGTDVVFKVSGEIFHAHKLFLSARSPIFQAQLDGENNGNEIVIDDMDPAVFKAVLHYIYRDTLVEGGLLTTSGSMSSVFDSMIAKIIVAADRYGLGRLRSLCESHICEDISTDNVASFLIVAKRSNAMELKAACLKFAAENLSVVMQSEGFNYLTENYPALQSEILETVVCSYVVHVSEEKSQSVCGQLEDSSNATGRRVRKRSSSREQQQQTV